MTLTIQDLGALGELLGSVAVLATLIYLAGANIRRIRKALEPLLGPGISALRQLREAPRPRE